MNPDTKYGVYQMTDKESDHEKGTCPHLYEHVYEQIWILGVSVPRKGT